jgi:uncharacterized protein YndB with AHSA1/START domain
MPRTDKTTRFITTGPERVYAALLDPGALIAWVPPGDMTGSIEHFDARPGGSYRMVLTYPDASGSPGKSTPDSDIVEARFIELVPGQQVVLAVDFASDDPAYAGTMTMTWDLTPLGEGTRVDITADNVPDGVSPQDHLAGMTSSLDKLAEYLDQQSTPATMPYTVDFNTVSIVGLESSPVAAALAGLRANEARYFKNKYNHVFTVEPASDATETIDWVHRILKEERDIVISSPPLEATAFQVENIRMAYVFYESGLSINVMYTIDDLGKRAVGFKLSEGMEVPAELASRFKFARQKSKLAGTIRGSYFAFKNEY